VYRALWDPLGIPWDSLESSSGSKKEQIQGYLSVSCTLGSPWDPRVHDTLRYPWICSFLGPEDDSR